jgi:ATP-binding cassette subfamily C protein CydC
LTRDRSRARNRLVEALDGRAELASFGASPIAARELQARFDALDAPGRRLSARDAAGEAVIATGASVTVSAILANGTGLLGPSLDPAILALAVLVAAALFEAAKGLGSAGQATAQARAAWRRLNGITGFGMRRPADDDLPTSRIDWEGSLRADVVIHDMSAGYGGRPVIEIPRLNIPHGTFAILTGPSGAGKSTLLAVVAGEVPPATGRVEVGGLDPHTLGYAERVAKITLVEQDGSILSGTVADNLRLARPSATESELDEALRVAMLDTSVQLSTAVGRSGAFLSGGQRRRLLLAQGYLRRPGLLLLDEPVEGLDSATARQVLANLRSALPDVTIVAAVHDRNQANLSPSVDQVIRLETGRPVTSS